MECITFTCKTITPMFLAGADGKTPELRVPSIKGAMRFWWRALSAHLSLGQLKEKETQIFGGSGENIRRSRVIIKVFPVLEKKSEHKPVPRKSFTLPAFDKGTEFEVQLSLSLNEDEKNALSFDINALEALFKLTCYLGGFGKRVRRGAGSVSITKVMKGDDIQRVDERVDLQLLLELIQYFSPFYQLGDDKIVYAYSGKSPQYGYVTQVQIGKAKENVLASISQVAHDLKAKYQNEYDMVMGYAYGGQRYASPLFVSVIEGPPLKPIITTLNLALPRNVNMEEVTLEVQEAFKDQLL